MEYNKLGIPLKETLEEFTAYLENLVTYNKLVLTKKACELSSYILLLVLILCISSFVLLFLSFAFAEWFNELTNLDIGAGYLVVAGFYVLLGAAVFVFRNGLIFNPIRKFFGGIFFDDDDSNSFSFKTEHSHSADIKKVRQDLVKQKETLSRKINALEHSLTLSNIANQIVGKAYNSIVTTSSIAKFTYKLVKKIKWFVERKKRKALKHKENKLLNEDND
ncbi:MAG: hypothetical protein H8E34_12200 [Bacteroidetes bacterium]|nr:hypothetical protein [Bacteroidota bacterium]MBL6944927.1 hypothetical protein [Bacteroidales bacterium]